MTQFFNELGIAIGHYGVALGFIRKHRLWYWLAIPCLLNLIAFVFVGYISWLYTGDLLTYMMSKIGVDGDSWWMTSLRVVLSMLVRLLVVMLYLKLFRYIVLIFFAPMLAFISDKVQEIDTGRKKPFSFIQLTKDVIRGVTIAIRNIFFEMAIIFTIFLFTLAVPIIAFAAPFLIFMVESYYFGFTMLDYRNEFMMIPAKESRKLINEHRGLALGIGGVFNAFLFVPILGALIAPVLSVVAGGLAFNKVEEVKM